MNAVSGFIMDFESFNAGGELATSDGAWFVTPDKRQAAAPPSKRILLMQLTSKGEISGLINLHGRTKAVTDSEGNVVGGQEAIQSEGLRFECKAPKRKSIFVTPGDVVFRKKGTQCGAFFCV